MSSSTVHSPPLSGDDYSFVVSTDNTVVPDYYERFLITPEFPLNRLCEIKSKPVQTMYIHHSLVDELVPYFHLFNDVDDQFFFCMFKYPDEHVPKIKWGKSVHYTGIRFCEVLWDRKTQEFDKDFDSSVSASY